MSSTSFALKIKISMDFEVQFIVRRVVGVGSISRTELKRLFVLPTYQVGSV